MSDVGLTDLKTVAEAIAVLDGVAVSPRVETVALPDADGRVLAVAVHADRDTPPFDKALMDGYAVRSADCVAAADLALAGELAAGQQSSATLAEGTCVAIMTGAPLPPGADAVVQVERTRRGTAGTGDATDGGTPAFAVVRTDGPVRRGDAVAPRGLEGAAGDVVLPAGTRLGPAQLATAAQVGAATLAVHARPRVGVLSTGDEVVRFDATPAGPQIRNGNTPMLMALVRRLGCDAVDLGHAKDDPARIAAKLATAGLDAVLVTGGMSMGVYDYTPRVLRDLGYDLAITKLKIKPGKPFVFARNGSGGPPFIFGLPGNPVSAFVCTVRLASRVLLRLGGASPEPGWCGATLAHDLPANGPREFYQPAANDAGSVRVLAWRGSADLFTLARADSLLIRPAGASPLPAGSPVVLLRLT